MSVAVGSYADVMTDTVDQAQSKSFMVVVGEVDLSAFELNTSAPGKKNFARCNEGATLV